MKKKRFTLGFKKGIVNLYLNGVCTGVGLAKELGIHPNTVYNWAKKEKQKNILRISEIKHELVVIKQSVIRIHER